MIRHIIFYTLSLFITIHIFAENSVASSSKNANQQGTVLLLNSYAQDMVWVEKITNGVIDTFNKTEKHFSVRIENMDTKMISSSKYYEVYRKYLDTKYKNVPFSVIIASDNNAYDFLRKYRDTMFPDVPVVFCGVNDFQPEQIKSLKSFTGIEENISFKETVEVILQNHPKTTEIFIVNDYLVTGRAWTKKIREDAIQMKIGPQIKFSDEISFPQLQKHISELPKTAVVVLGSYYSDSLGYSSTYERIGEELAKSSNVPVYCLAEPFINKQVIGGFVISGYLEGIASAQIALKIIDGADPNNIPVTTTGSNKAIFNYPSLIQYGISEDVLPPNSIIINRPFSVYEEYFVQIWSIIFSIGILVLIIGFLIVNTIKRKRIEQALKSSEQNFRAFFEMASVGVAQIDIRSGQYKKINRKYCEIVGLSLEKLLNLKSDTITHPDDIDNQLQQMQLLRDGDINEFTIEKRYIRQDGVIIWTYLTLTPLWEGDQEPDYALAVLRDITPRKHAEERLVFAQKIFDNSIEGIAVTDIDGTILQVNSAFSTITGYEAAEVLGKNPRILRSNKHPSSFYKEMWNKILTEGQWTGEIWNRRKTGEAYPEWLTISSVKDEKGKITNFVSIFHDISQHVEQQEVIQYQTQHDALTQLPNRILINDRLENALEKAQRSGLRIALLYLDIDNFKYLNDAFGHIVGDDILIELSKRFSSVMRTGDTLARLGGDDFLVLLTDIDDLSVVNNIAMRLLNSLEQPFFQGDVEYFVTVSIGITISPEDSTDPVTLLKNADIAMYRAKNTGKNNYQYYAPELDVQVHRRIALEMQLRKSIEREEFELFYQPLVHSTSGKIVGVEALIRWRSEGKIISPGEFIPLAEESGLILPMGEWILRTAAQQAKIWQDAGYDLTVSINISSKQFVGQDLEQLLEEVITQTGVDPERLYLEITESMIMGDLFAAQRIMGAVRNLGLKFYLDDFGTGYSSLAYLKKLPIDGLKIDKSFVNDIVEDSDSEAIATVIASLANTLNLQIVAEGVETIEQWEMLSSMSDMLIQGYIVSKPVPALEFEQLFLKGDIHWKEL